jgi:hypothetical protein
MMRIHAEPDSLNKMGVYSTGTAKNPMPLAAELVHEADCTVLS